MNVVPGPPPVPPPPPIPASRAPRRARRRRVLAVCAIGVVVLVVIAGLWYLGYLFPSSSGPSTTPEPFSQASAQASAYAVRQTGGPWTLVEAYGVGFPTSTPVNTANPGHCPGRVPPFSTWPADSAGVGSGKYPTWEFGYTNSTGTIPWYLGVLVQEGTASTAYLSTSYCASFPFPVHSSTIVDSTVAASAVDGAGGSAFLSNHSNAGASMELLQFLGSGPVWLVDYYLCVQGAGGLAGEQPILLGEVNATSGALVGGGPGPPSDYNCSSSYPSLVQAGPPACRNLETSHDATPLLSRNDA